MPLQKFTNTNILRIVNRNEVGIQEKEVVNKGHGGIKAYEKIPTLTCYNICLMPK